MSQASAEGEVRAWFPDGAGDRKVGERMIGWHGVDFVGDQAEPVAEVGHADDDGGVGCGVEDHPDRVFAIADAERVDLDRRRVCGDGGADLEHVRAKDAFFTGDEVIGVVLHEGGAARAVVAITFSVRSRVDVFQSPSPPKP